MSPFNRNFRASMTRTLNELSALKLETDQAIAYLKQCTNAKDIKSKMTESSELASQIITTTEKYRGQYLRWKNAINEIEDDNTKTAEELEMNQYLEDQSHPEKHPDDVEDVYRALSRTVDNAPNVYCTNLLKLRDADTTNRIISEPLPLNTVPEPSANPSTSSLNVALEDMPRFTGDCWQWNTFWKQFEELVDRNRSLSNTKKLHLLRQSLKGEPYHSISDLQIVDSNYSEAVNILQTLYDQPLQARFQLNQKITALRAASKSPEDQLTLVNRLKPLLIEYRTVDPSSSRSSSMLVTILNKFDDKWKELAIENLNGQTDRVEDVLSLIQSKLLNTVKVKRSMQQMEVDRHDRAPRREQVPPTPAPQTPTPRSAIQSRHNPAPPKWQPRETCVFCGKHNNSATCRSVPSLEQRKQICTDKRLCTRCLHPGHTNMNCNNRNTCRTCHSNHHLALCPQSPPSTNNVVPANRDPQRGNPRSTNISVITGTREPHHSVPHSTERLWTGTTEVMNPDSGEVTTADFILDSGAMINVISENLADELNLPNRGSEYLTIKGASGIEIGTKKYQITDWKIKVDGGWLNLNGIRMTDPIIDSLPCTPLSQADQQHLEQNNIRLTVDPRRTLPYRPRIIIRSSDMIKLLEGSTSTCKLPSGLSVISTKLGNIVAGEEYQKPHKYHPVQFVNLLTMKEFQQNVEQFLALDQAGTSIESTEKEEKKKMENAVEKHFEDTVEHKDHKYQVKYFLKENIALLPDNKALSFKRLSSAWSQLQKNKEHLLFYDKLIKDQLAAGQIEEVPYWRTSEHLVHYVPHQGVLRPDKPTTPLRIVFDASASVNGAISLNDTIEAGPNLLELIPVLLLRARTTKHLVTADVEKAFLQVMLHPSQRDLLRFFWLKDPLKPPSKENTVTYRFRVTPFGVNQSPYLLAKVIQYHVQHLQTKPEWQPIVDQIKINVYVDNLLFCTDEIPEELYQVTKEVFKNMGMNLREYVSTDSNFNSTISEPDRGKSGLQKLLGVKWDPGEDLLHLSSAVPDRASTKRSVFSSVASVFDPLGLTAPILLPAKLFVQNLWNKQYTWDAQFTTEDQKEWNRIENELNLFKKQIPRHLGIRTVENLHLVVFTDASQKAMGAAIYALDQQNHGNLVISRTRLAPLKLKATIPKLETEGFLLGYHLLEYTVDALLKQIPANKMYLYMYTDATTVLHWFHSQKQYRLGPYISNRLKKVTKIIEKLVSLGVTLNNPRYVSTKENPADHLTRGLDAKQMNQTNHNWWNGPTWLQQPAQFWPNQTLPEGHVADDIPEKITVVAPLVVHNPVEYIVNPAKYSSISKCIRVMVYVLRFVNNCRANKTKSTTTVPESDELQNALYQLIRVHQQKYLSENQLIDRGLLKLDEHGIWRGNTRKIMNIGSDNVLSHSPVYLPRGDRHLITLLIRDIHERRHHVGVDNVLNELKMQYWIPNGRAQVKQVLKRCVPCRKMNNRPFQYPSSPPLPEERVRFSRPFESTGIDFIGPFRGKTNEPLYVIIFTCFTTRMSHLESVQSMDTSTFVMALKRFCARRGTPRNVLSDKASTFHTAKSVISVEELTNSNDVNTFFAEEGISWKHTTAHAPWQGGIYERLVGCVKTALYKAIGHRKLTIDEFTTIITEIEGTINSRPLSYVASDDIQSFQHPVIRPIDFVVPGMKVGLSVNNEIDGDTYLPPDMERQTRTSIIRNLQKHIDIVTKFWDEWRKTYLVALRDKTAISPLHQKQSTPTVPKKGEVVIVVDESGNTHRSTWPLALVIDVNGTSVTLRSQKGRTIERPLNLLVPLEISCTEPDNLIATTAKQDSVPHPMMTRSRTRNPPDISPPSPSSLAQA